MFSFRKTDIFSFSTDVKLTRILILAAYILLSPFVTEQNDSYTEDPYNLLFTTNTEELEDVPIYFESELPKWLRGTLVSVNFEYIFK